MHRGRLAGHEQLGLRRSLTIHLHHLSVPNTVSIDPSNSILVQATKSDSRNMSDPKHDELHKQLFEEGLKMRRSVVGDEYVNRALENGSTEFSRAGQELVTEFCWGQSSEKTSMCPY